MYFSIYFEKFLLVFILKNPFSLIDEYFSIYLMVRYIKKIIVRRGSKNSGTYSAPFGGVHGKANKN